MRVRLLSALCAVLAVALAGCTAATPTPPPSDVRKSSIPFDGDWGWTKQPTATELGVTHTQDSLNDSEPDAARSRGEKILSSLSEGGAAWQNVHLMGFGTLNPEPSPDKYDWASLDARMKLVKDTGGKTVLTLCCSPDWMKGGPDGETDWDKLEKEPLPEHFEDFAKLAAATVTRYPQIERVLVWNELKGFFDDDENRWNYEGYTELYNAVYKAVKAARPEVQVGGPYPVITSLDPDQNDKSDVRGDWGVIDQRSLDIIDYWLKNNAGADFIAVDGSTSTRQDTRPSSVEVGAAKFVAVDEWLRQRTQLPIWWTEFYSDVPQGADPGPSSPASAVADLATIAAMTRSGAAGALKWGPQGSDSLKYASLWTDSTEADGGQSTPLTSAWQWLVPRLAKGDVEIGHSPTQTLLAFRADDGVLVVNTSGEQVTPGAGEPVPAWGVVVTGRDA